MRSPVRNFRANLEFNMTPMIDVVMQLIVFFLVAGQLSQQETQVELNLPAATQGQRPPEDQSRRVTVNVLPDGTIILAGQTVTSEEFGRRLQAEHSQSREELEVRIRSDRQVPFRVIEPLLVACARASVWKVTFAVTPAGR